MPSALSVDSQKSGWERGAADERMGGLSGRKAKTGRIRASSGASGAAASPVVGSALSSPFAACHQISPCLQSRVSFV